MELHGRKERWFPVPWLFCLALANTVNAAPPTATPDLAKPPPLPAPTTTTTVEAKLPNGNSSVQVPANAALPLREAISMSLKANHDVLKAAHVLQASKAKLSTTRSQLFPKIELEVDAGTFHDRQPIPGDVGIPKAARDRNSYIAQLRFSQSLFAGFKNSSSIERYGAEENGSQLDLEIAKEKAIEDTIRLYFGVQLLEKQISAEKEVQSLRENQLKDIDRRFSQGRATDLQQLQARYWVKQQVPKILMLETDLSSQRLKLYRTLNLPLDRTFDLTDRLPANTGDPISFKLPTLPEALDYALRNSLRIRKLETQFQSLQAQSGEGLAPHLPSLDLELTAGTNAYQRFDIASSDSLAYGAELKLKVPLFSGLDSMSDHSYWRSRLDELKEDRARLRETLLEELNETYRRLEMSSHRIEASRANLDLTERAVRKSEDFYKMGRATLNEVLDAYGAMLEARKQSAQDVYDRIVALFHIKSLLGLGALFESE